MYVWIKIYNGRRIIPLKHKKKPSVISNSILSALRNCRVIIHVFIAQEHCYNSNSLFTDAHNTKYQNIIVKEPFGRLSIQFVQGDSTFFSCFLLLH